MQDRQPHGVVFLQRVWDKTAAQHHETNQPYPKTDVRELSGLFATRSTILFSVWDESLSPLTHKSRTVTFREDVASTAV